MRLLALAAAVRREEWEARRKKGSEKAKEIEDGHRARVRETARVVAEMETAAKCRPWTDEERQEARAMIRSLGRK
jgi:hypothetical protein